MTQVCHLLTSEYPPQPGGVSDYTRQVAVGLAAQSIETHVWCPESVEERCDDPGVTVHPVAGSFGSGDLVRLDAAFNKCPSPRRLIVQWVPQGFGLASMNILFCAWLLKRAKRNGDRVELMIHEPFCEFRGSWRQRFAAAMHRLMTLINLAAASHVWLSIPDWERMLQAYRLGRKLPFSHLPIPSTIPVVNRPVEVRRIREQLLFPEARSQDDSAACLIGHFGTYGRHVREMLDPLIPDVLFRNKRCSIVLLGRGGTEVRDQAVRENPGIANRVHATGELTSDDVSLHLQACDMMVQPYGDGVSSRRTSTMAALSHGIPVVTTTGHLTERHWRDGAVCLSGAGDYAGWQECVLKLTLDSRSRRCFGVAGLKLYEDKFDLTHTLHRICDTDLHVPTIEPTSDETHHRLHFVRARGRN